MRLPPKSGRRESRSADGEAGFTLVEVLVTLVILAILASAALPYAEVTIRRQQELELRRSLREIRTAIDQFHRHWEQGRIAGVSDAASQDGYPKTLEVLVAGVPLAGEAGRKHYYLRRVPRDPFADQSLPPAEQWALRSYRDSPDTDTWGGEGVYDIRSRSSEKALDGSRYDQW